MEGLESSQAVAETLEVLWIFGISEPQSSDTGVLEGLVEPKVAELVSHVPPVTRRQL